MAQQLQTEMQKALVLTPRKISNALAERNFISSIKSYHLREGKLYFGKYFSE